MLRSSERPFLYKGRLAAVLCHLLLFNRNGRRAPPRVVGFGQTSLPRPQDNHCLVALPADGSTNPGTASQRDVAEGRRC